MKEGKTIQAVKRQADRADKLWKETYEKPAEPPLETATTAQETQPAENAPVTAETPPVQPQAPEPEPDYKTLYSQTTERLKGLESLLDTERQKYSTLKGKYDAEMPTLLQRVNLLTQEMEKLKSSPHPENSPAEPAKTGAAKTLREEFPDIYEGVHEMIRETVANLVANEVSQIRSRVDEISETSKKDAVKTFKDKLAEIVPNWQDIDKDPAFEQWLKVNEPHGRSRHEMLIDAYSRQDLKGTAYYFTEFLKAKSPSPPQDTPSKPTNVTIPRGSSPQPSTNQTGEAYTRADLAKLYDDKVKGVYRGKEEEYRRKEAKMIRALTGR